MQLGSHRLPKIIQFDRPGAPLTEADIAKACDLMRAGCFGQSGTFYLPIITSQ